jgi:hypothetical protein
LVACAPEKARLDPAGESVFFRVNRKRIKPEDCRRDPSLGIVNPNAGGIDVGNESHFAAVPDMKRYRLPDGMSLYEHLQRLGLKFLKVKSCDSR